MAPLEAAMEEQEFTDSGKVEQETLTLALAAGRRMWDCSET
jgi:hypothetical protein